MRVRHTTPYKHHCLVRAGFLTCTSITVCTWDSDSPDYGNAAYTNRWQQGANKFGQMKQLPTTLFFIAITSYCMAQSSSDIVGTWALYKITVNNREVIESEDEKFADTLIIKSETFEQRVWVKNEPPFRQIGRIALRKGKIIVTNRTTSTLDNGQPPDIYFKYKLKNETLIMSNATLINESNNSPARFHYQKLKIK